MASLEYYRALLPVDKHALDDQLERHAQYQDEIGRELNLADAAAARAKDDLDTVEAYLFLEIKNSGDKVPNDVANAQVQTHRQREKAHDILMTLQGQAADWRKLYDAWQQRGWSIKALGELYSSEYFRLTSVSGTPRRHPEEDMVKAIRQEQRSKVRRSFRE